MIIVDCWYFKQCSYFRNSKNIVKQVTGGENNKISKSGGYYAYGGSTRLEYDEAPHAISGAAVRQYGYPEYSNVSGQ